jgi:hypothetical protein
MFTNVYELSRMYKTKLIGLKLQGVKYGYCFLLKQGRKYGEFG